MVIFVISGRTHATAPARSAPGGSRNVTVQAKSEASHISSMRNWLWNFVADDAAHVLLTTSRTNRADVLMLTNCAPRWLGIVPDVTVLNVVPFVLTCSVKPLIRADCSVDDRA